MRWKVVFAKHALKDAKKIDAAGLKEKAKELLELLASNPFQNPPHCEKLVGDLEGAYSRRINILHRLVYEVFKKERTVRVLRMLDPLRVNSRANMSISTDTQQHEAASRQLLLAGYLRR